MAVTGIGVCQLPDEEGVRPATSSPPKGAGQDLDDIRALRDFRRNLGCQAPRTPFLVLGEAAFELGDVLVE